MIVDVVCDSFWFVLGVSNHVSVTNAVRPPAHTSFEFSRPPTAHIIPQNRFIIQTVYVSEFILLFICVKLAVYYSKIHDSTTIVAFRTMTYVYVCLYRRFKRVYSYL